MGAELLALLPLITGAASAFGSSQEGKGQAKLANYNALVSEQLAKAIQEASDWNIAAINRKKAKFLSTMKVGYAKGGVRNEGSVIEGMVDSATNFEMDKISERYNSAMQISSARSEASMWRMQADNYKRAGNFKAGTTLLSSALNSASMFAKFGGPTASPLQDTNGGRGTYIQTTDSGGWRHA